MEAKERKCILCGAKEVMHGYICAGCQDKIQREVVAHRLEMRKTAGEAQKKSGAVPEEDR